MLSAEFNKPAGPYFLSHSVGLLPLDAQATLQDAYFAPWAAGDAEVWSTWLVAVDRFREALAPVIGASAEDICPQTNVSSALSKILFSLPLKKGRTKIVLSEEDFPSIGYVIAQAERLGLTPVFIKGGANLADADMWSAAYRDDVHLVHITHVYSNLGLMTPVAEIVARARANGAVTVVDAAQSAGSVEVAADRWEPDFLTGTSVKYLCGGPGACFLWVNPEMAPHSTPADVGWFSHENPFEFDIHHFVYAHGARRFWGGTPSVAPFAIASAGARLIADKGVATIARKNQMLLERVFSQLPAECLLSHATAGERGCSFVIRPREFDKAAALREEKIAHDQRMGGLRFSVHLYNDESDVSRLIATLEPFL